ncbi:MAG: 1-(5-phosphoribosyl)-5-[(5-phosphoribosylamino)methylideneamino]imidazole-4-carboxamide isomerase [Candidatus Omnitrophica bacterium]|nr:1-(5-phosphoribosyl)-5-[(5-phosphoribosylamino)methylideneamino]imidazole-4-carboxamide isomerase [Candidatus Omnitrophota bacterium]
MILIPAIDMKEGKVVRLFQGKFSDVTQYGDDPVKTALQWERLGARWLHLVDLDGAKTGDMLNEPQFRGIIKEIGIPVEIGGGIRSRERVDELVKMGFARVILGTKAIEDRDFLKSVISDYGEKICVSLDCTNGFVAQRGWVSTTNIKAVDLAMEFEAMGLEWMVYTDIARDGTLSGPNFEELQTMLDTVKKINIIASGGIATLEDVQKLSAMKGLAAAITGKAIYEGTLDFKEAVAFLK